MTKQTLADPGIDEVREARQRISDACGNDPDRLVAYFIALQERHRDRLLPEKLPRKSKARSAA